MPSDSGSEKPQDVQVVVAPSLLPAPATLSKPNDSLCDTCRALGLTPRQFVVLPNDNQKAMAVADPNTFHLGLVQDIKKKLHCPLCRLVLIALGSDVPSFKDGEPVEVTMGWSTEGPLPDSNSPWHLHTPQIRILRPYVRKQGHYMGGKGLNMFPEITLLANDAPTPSKTFFGRLINDQIDFAMVRNWLSMCKSRHGSQCDKSQMLDHKVDDPAAEIPSFRLIDVIDNCIIHAPHNCKYVALSYVWGKINPQTIMRTLKANVAELEKPGGLSLPDNHDRIPLTIRDAMHLVRELHLRYLWVDSLCIIQDDLGDGGSKMDAISKMDLVYGAAYLTVIAATGIDANAGLPGLRPGTRKIPQPVEEVQQGLRLVFRPKHQDYISNSVYHTRAWTFQEQMFKQRSLIFIGGQVVYECRRASGWREDVFFEDRGTKDGGGTDTANNNDIGGFEGLIGTYSNLSLSFDTDIYHAFAGIARYFKTALNANLCHGIPDAFFDWFLLWRSLAPQKRREGAPSWSWSGWFVGSSSNIWDWYTRSIARIRVAMPERTWIIWYQRKAHDSTECVKVWQHPPSPSSPTNFYGGLTQNRFPFDCSPTLPTPRTLAGAPKYIEDTHNPTPGSGFLQFWTVSAMFNLAQPTSDDDQRGRGLEDARSRLGIFGRNGRELGTILVNPDWHEKFVPKPYEFIILCEGRDVRAEDGRIDGEDGWMFRVMLIEWRGDWAERVSMGSIGKQDLNQALGEGSVWKEIILG